MPQLQNPDDSPAPDKNLASLEHLADIIMLLQRCFIQRLSDQLSHGQISFPQYFLLTHLHTNTILPMKEVARLMNHSTAAATGLVDRLEKMGYIRRTSCPTDRRKVIVEITKKGLTLVAKIRQDIIKNLHEFSKNLTSDELACWLQIYEKMFHYCKSTEQKPRFTK